MMSYLSVKERQNSLSSLYSSSMESLSSSHGAESIDQELAPTSTASTIPRLRVKTSDYDTGISTTEFEEEKKHSKKSGRVRKAFSFNRQSSRQSSKVKKAASVDVPHSPDASELMARLTLLEDQVRNMGKELHKEREHREELSQKVENLQSENEELKSERKVAGDQLQKFYKKFFDSVHSVPPHLMYDGLSTTSLNMSSLSMRTSISSIRTSASSITSQ